MAIRTERRISLDAFLALPEEEPALELEPEGRVEQKVAPQARHSSLQVSLVQWLAQAGAATGAGRAFTELRATFGGGSVVPDVSFYRLERIPVSEDGELLDDVFVPPDLAVEIVSPGQSTNRLVRRCFWYVRNGVQVALLVDPADRSILMIRAGQEPRAYAGPETLDLGDVVPGLRLVPDELFASLRVR